jgi:hypothetical protein
VRVREVFAFFSQKFHRCEYCVHEVVCMKSCVYEVLCMKFCV